MKIASKHGAPREAKKQLEVYESELLDKTIDSIIFCLKEALKDEKVNLI
jgi:hypothetical protein